MGYWSEIDIELREDNEDDENSKIQIADLLGISIEDLEELDYVIETDQSKDGELYAYRIEFNIENSSPVVVAKLKNLEDGCRVYLSIGDLESDEDYIENEG